MDKIALWGIGKDFYTIYPRILVEEQNNNISITMLIDNNVISNIYNFKVKKPCELNKDDVDYVIITSGRYYWHICCELLDRGFSRTQIINGWIFLEKDFEYEKYKRMGWLNDNIVGDFLSDTTYIDLDREYRKRDLSIKLGRKSYIGQGIVVDGGRKVPMNITIGNYTSIAWDCKFDMGLNLDHDYTRVTNYGLTHIEWCKYVIPDKECEVEIGSDVWIGYDVVIKSGIKIGDGAVIASHSVVVKDVEPFSIVGGNPASIIKKRFSDDIISKMKKVKWWNWPSEKLMKYEKVLNNPVEFLKMIDVS